MNIQSQNRLLILFFYFLFKIHCKITKYFNNIV